MRWYNPLYSRKWPRIFMPVSTFFLQLGKHLGTSNTENHDYPSTHTTSTSNGHVNHAVDDRDAFGKTLSPSSSMSTLFSTFAAPFQSNHHRSSAYYPKRINGVKKSPLESSPIYHELSVHHSEDEQSNQHAIFLPLSTDYSNGLLINTHEKNRPSGFSRKENLLWIFWATLLYFLWFIFIAGISFVHVLIYSSLLFLYVLADRTRRLVLAILIYLAYLLLYDALRLVPNYTVSKVHIRDIYLIEKKVFGIYVNGDLMTLNEYFQQHHIPFLDVLTGLCYLNWIPIPITYSLYLYRYRSKREYMDFALTFLLTNILGFIVYYIIPTAPPWYIEQYGFEFNLQAAGNPAGFIHFDQITGLKIFSSMYSKNANVFAAIPSLHAAYPLITVLYGSLSKRLWLHLLFVVFTLGVWFSAVYSRHHYVLDVLAGGLCAITAYLLYRFLSRRSPIDRLLDAYSKLI